MKIVFITGIDTGIGKSIATGWLAQYLLRQGISVITAKLVQTGGENLSDDLRWHRQIMGWDWTHWDLERVTCPYVFRLPVSPHLAARQENRRFEPSVIDQAIQTLAPHFDLLLMEGAGGICVPLDNTYTILDFIQARHWPCVVVTSPRLGSINHTLLTVDTLHHRQLPVLGLLYNCFVQVPNLMVEETRDLFQRIYPDLPVIDLPAWNLIPPPPLVDFSPLALGSQ